MPPPWQPEIDAALQHALQLAGLGQSARSIATTLEYQYPDLSIAEARRIAVQAHAARAAAQVLQAGGPTSSVAGCGGPSVEGVPAGQSYVDIEFTLSGGRGWRGRRVFIRVTLPSGATMADVQAAADDFAGWYSGQYGRAVSVRDRTLRVTSILCS